MAGKKKKLKREIAELEKRLEAVYQAGQWGIAHVGAANYAERQHEAESKLEQAFFGAEDDTPIE